MRWHILGENNRKSSGLGAPRAAKLGRYTCSGWRPQRDDELIAGVLLAGRLPILPHAKMHALQKGHSKMKRQIPAALDKELVMQ
jgi:hypothetical protein